MKQTDSHDVAETNQNRVKYDPSLTELSIGTSKYTGTTN